MLHFWRNASLDCDVLLLCAGFGKRLGDLTKSIPKPLVRVGGQTLIDRNLKKLSAAGFSKAIINTHYLGQKIISHVQTHNSYDIEVLFSEEDPILNTGGAVKNIEPLLSAPRLLIVNCDIVLDDTFDFREFIIFHKESKLNPLATLTLRDDPNKAAYGTLGISKSGRILSFLGEQLIASETITQELMFTGVSLIERQVVSSMPPAGSVFSLTQGTYRTLLSKGEVLNSFIFNGYWNDVGTPERLAEANKFFE